MRTHHVCVWSPVGAIERRSVAPGGAPTEKRGGHGPPGNHGLAPRGYYRPPLAGLEHEARRVRPATARHVAVPGRPAAPSCAVVLNHGSPTPEARAFTVPRSPRCFFATSYAQRRTPKSACQKPSNSSQNRSKRRRFPSKRHQKSAHFVMPILTFGGLAPSGASARAVLTFRKGLFGVFRAQKRRVEKLSTKCGKL